MLTLLFERMYLSRGCQVIAVVFLATSHLLGQIVLEACHAAGRSCVDDYVWGLIFVIIIAAEKKTPKSTVRLMLGSANLSPAKYIY